MAAAKRPSFLAELSDDDLAAAQAREVIFPDKAEREAITQQRIKERQAERNAEKYPIDRARVQQTISELNDELMLEAAEVLKDMGHWRTFDPTLEEPPKEWVEELGEKKAWERFRVARAAWCTAKDAPMALKMAKEVYVGLAKARSTENAAPKELNVQFVVMSKPAPQFPVIEVRGDESK